MNYFDDLTDDLDARPAAAPKAPAQRFPCMSCGGTGRYRGPRVHQTATECFACGGRGYHKQAPHVRKAANEKRKATIARNAADRVANFREAEPALYACMVENRGWNSFFASLLEQLPTRELSERQVDAARRSAAKIADRQASRAAEKAAVVEKTATDVGVSAIDALFAAAKKNGLKKPIFRTDRLTISPAPASGRNAGAIYVKDRGEYAGKIVAGRFLPVQSAASDVGSILQTIATDPASFARSHGRATGTCCCCGRELTDPASVAAGIGPICEANWGF